MRESSARPVLVEGHPLVRHREKQNAARPQDPVPLLQGADRVGQMLDDVVRNHEALAGIGNHRHGVSVCQNVGLHQGVASELRVVLTLLFQGHLVDVTHPRPCGIHRHRVVQRSDLDPAAGEVLLQPFASRFQATAGGRAGAGEDAQQASQSLTDLLQPATHVMSTPHRRAPLGICCRILVPPRNYRPANPRPYARRSRAVPPPSRRFRHGPG